MNQELSKIFFEMAELLEMKGVQFKPRAFEKAAHSVEALDEDIKDIYKKGGIKAFEDIPGVGKGIAERIEEFIKTGKIKDYDRLKKEMPVDVSGLTAIEGVGPKIIKTLYKELKIKSVQDLEKAAKAGKLKSLPRFGEKLEQKILKGVEFQKKSAGRINIGEAMPLARKIIEYLKNVPGVKRVEVAGSLRRWQESVGDLDFLAISSKPKLVSERFVKMSAVSHVYARGNTKSLVRLRRGIDADLRVLPHKSFGAALQYFTGSKDHNIALRKIAIKKKYKLNEYGLFHGKKLIEGRDEEKIYKKLGLDWMPPELRTASGEIEAAQKHRLPKLIGYGDLKGDLQTQTDWSDGANSIEEMALEARRLGHEYIGITDHTKSLAMTGGADDKKLLRQIAYIEKLNKKMPDIRILSGAEVNISKDGSFDISDAVLAKLDFAGGAIHSAFNLSEQEQTERLIKAMQNPNIDIIFHPTTRIPMKREPIKLDFERIFKEAVRTGTILEIDGHPWRLDLHDILIREAKKYGIKFVIDTDAHSTSELSYLEYGIAQARRGWAEKSDIVNTLPLKNLLELLKKPKNKRFNG
ncbi:MAG: DNA polymerase III [Candidatus Niyogibacteria bacterium RIFCSPLOWO2_01_FULL_45_48]|uniref:DNA polymerase beta n=2 Tax=Candidatus Niyogiibacteriota TaxID=1817912 RepID=A0A1G2EY88_9BACT|nr:MAG: DNA polymerase III [Candidatus Niyogibacteria bacterium RIFCSPLOWO2_02_FULL_45_13]OGZ30893.1 MAG: DNA polymerase III [Candidatus Niyogibacteria bacterium RIFCSPHIGHO2_01_FULL_45_28]OGZ31306.1 MAG: DNA polymerase III [Candidatus Niyogibacteria bacterium RIFCSPLOWO2_01_FULL_45_48]